MESAARVYLHPILNRGVGDKLTKLQSMVREYRADGVMLHSDRSCKPYSIGQVDQRDQLAGDVGVPSLLLEADHSDPRVFSEQQVENRIAAFLEMLGV
jgi:benzoyl-CoA reductase/2-hydroxyglutaryl-CoA dehydratase subunit BcrC/BadD/HgdB